MITRDQALRRLGVHTRHRIPAVDSAVVALVAKKPMRSKHDRGYSCDGEKLYLNGRLIAFWHAGAARVFHQHIEFCPYMVANATASVKKRLKWLEMFADPEERACFEHEDCVASRELGAACSDARWAPPRKPYFDRQQERRATQRRSVKSDG